MSWWSRLRERVTGSADGAAGVTEVHSGRPEDTGGVPNDSADDQHSTTGTTPHQTFVGRTAGDDPGYLETGAEARADREDERRRGATGDG